MQDSQNRPPQDPAAAARLAAAEDALGIGVPIWKLILLPHGKKKMNPVLAIILVFILLPFGIVGALEVYDTIVSGANVGTIVSSDLNLKSTDWPIPIVYTIRLTNGREGQASYICSGLRSQRSCTSDDIVPNGTKVRVVEQPDGSVLFGSPGTDIASIWTGFLFMAVGLYGAWSCIVSAFIHRWPKVDPLEGVETHA